MPNELQGGIYGAVSQCYMFLCPSVHGLIQYGHLNNSCQLCFMFSFVCNLKWKIYFKKYVTDILI